MEQEKIDIEKSQELADHINSIKMILHFMDIDHAKKAASLIRKQASFQDSAAVLNPMYNPEKSNLLLKQAEMLDCLVRFVEIGKEVDEMKKSISATDSNRERIMKMFI